MYNVHMKLLQDMDDFFVFLFHGVCVELRESFYAKNLLKNNIQYVYVFSKGTVYK